MEHRMVGITSRTGWLAATFLLVGLVLVSAMPGVHAATIIGSDPTVGTQTCGPCSSTLSWMHTVGSNPNRILIVGVSEFHFSTPFAVTGVTFGGTALTPLTAQTNGFLLVQQWYLLNPSLSGTVTVTFATAPDAVVAGSVSLFNVGGVGASNGATGRGPPASVTIASANSGDLVVDTLVHQNPDTSPVAPQAQLWNLNDPTAVVMGGGSDKPASSSVTMQWTDFPSSENWGLVAVDLQPPPPQPAVHPVYVGGEMLPLNLVQVVAPWAAAMLALTAVAVETLVIRRKKSRKA